MIRVPTKPTNRHDHQSNTLRKERWEAPSTEAALGGRAGVLQLQGWLSRFWCEVTETKSRAVAIELLYTRISEVVSKEPRITPTSTAAAFLLGFLITPLLPPTVQAVWRGTLLEVADLAYSFPPQVLHSAATGSSTALTPSMSLNVNMGTLVEGLYFPDVFRLADRSRAVQSDAVRRKVVSSYLRHTVTRVVGLWQGCLKRDFFFLWRSNVRDKKKVTAKNKRMFARGADKVAVHLAISNWRRIARIHHLRSVTKRNAQLVERITIATNDQNRVQERLLYLRDDVAAKEVRRNELIQQRDALTSSVNQLDAKRKSLIERHYNIRREWHSVLWDLFGDLRPVPTTVGEWMGRLQLQAVDTPSEIKKRVEARRTKFSPSVLLGLMDVLLSRNDVLLDPEDSTPQEQAAAVCHQFRQLLGGNQQAVRATDLLRGDQFSQELLAALLLQVLGGGHCRALEPTLECEQEAPKPECNTIALSHPLSCSAEPEVMLADWQVGMRQMDTSHSIRTHVEGAIGNAIRLGSTVQAHRQVYQLYERFSSMTPSGDFPRDAVEDAIKELVPVDDWPLVELLYPIGGITSLAMWSTYVSEVVEVEGWDVQEFLIRLEESVEVTPLMEFAAHMADEEVRGVLRQYKVSLEALFIRYSQEVQLPALVQRTNTWQELPTKSVPPRRRANSRTQAKASAQPPLPPPQRFLTKPGFKSLIDVIRTRAHISHLGDDEAYSLFAFALRKKIVEGDPLASASRTTSTNVDDLLTDASPGVSKRGLPVLMALLSQHHNPCPFTPLHTKLEHFLARLF